MTDADERADVNANVPESTVARLPLYLHALAQTQALRIAVVSSVQIAEIVGTNAAQVRKDLSHLGELGTRGTGYDVDSLMREISRRLGLTRTRNVAIVGYGRLGGALRHYGGFMDRGFSVAAVLDSDPTKIGRRSGDLRVLDVAFLEETIYEKEIDIVVITTPAAVAQEIADRVVSTHVTSILNFAPVRLEVPEETQVRYVDLASEMQILSYHLARTQS